MINIFRKKNKFTVFLALTAAILMLCTGCVRSGVGITIEPNDTGTVEISVGINEKYLDTLKEYSESENPFAGEDTVTVTDGDDKYICTVEKKTFENLEELKTILLELEYNFASLEDEGFSMDDDTLVLIRKTMGMTMYGSPLMVRLFRWMKKLMKRKITTASSRQQKSHIHPISSAIHIIFPLPPWRMKQIPRTLP